MARFTWKEDNLISLRLRDGSFALGQLLKSPYIAFFAAFREDDAWPADAAESTPPLFFCAVASVVFKFSTISQQPNVRPKRFEQVPYLWIKRFTGSRKVTVWRGTERERQLLLLSERPGGQLVEKHMDASGPGNPKVIVPSIPLDDDETIDSYEMNVIATYPNLNERLLLCKQLGKNVDPEKDLTFDRPMRPEYANYLDMLAQKGRPEDWGYSSKPSGK
jgi:hypothetical protein